jgi:para-aminobenzoate synthetase / 4-amino-4-deoxychorismate lyase
VVTDSALRELSRLRCRLVRERLSVGPSQFELVQRAEGADGLVALTGSWAGGGALITSDPLLVVTDEAVAAVDVLPVVSDSASDSDIVGGGWFGWFGYSGPSRMAFHDHVLRQDADGVWWFEALWSDARDAVLQARRAEWQLLLESSAAVPSSWSVGAFAGAPMQTHLAAVERGIELIRAGEIYQVNVCTRLSASRTGNPAGVFAAAASRLHPAFGAYVDDGVRAVASMSPELFLRRRGRDVMTSPIKGTWPRVSSDDDGADALRASVKDAAENVMIVDLMRNDLGRVSETGTVHARSLLDIEAHPGVWHLVSTVVGTLRDGVGDAELLRATLPPGSVTGAPKLRAVEAIAELEDVPRGAYTGAVGFVSPSWGLELSVLIRTFELSPSRIELGVGGGVTADSVPMLEWRECLHKAAPLLGALGSTMDVSAVVSAPSVVQLDGGLLETMLAVDGVVLRLADHVARLDRSCRELYRAGLPAGVGKRVAAAGIAAAGAGVRRAVVRIVVTPSLEIDVTCVPVVTPSPTASTARIVEGRVGLWRHKWADRSYLAAVESASGDVPLFLGEDGAVLETSRGNVFLLQADGSLVTPPLRDDLLPGVTRRALLDLARDQGRPTYLRTFDPAELAGAAAVFWTSSLSGAVPLVAVDDVELPRRDDDVAAFASALQSGGAVVVR